MSESKHTPGPWVYNFIPEHIRANEMVIDAPTDRVIYHAANWPVKEADARLIAAAPALLDACKAVRDDIKRIHPPNYVISHKTVDTIKILIAEVEKGD